MGIRFYELLPDVAQFAEFAIDRFIFEVPLPVR